MRKDQYNEKPSQGISPFNPANRSQTLKITFYSFE